MDLLSVRVHGTVLYSYSRTRTHKLTVLVRVPYGQARSGDVEQPSNSGSVINPYSYKDLGVDCVEQPSNSSDIANWPTGRDAVGRLWRSRVCWPRGSLLWLSKAARHHRRPGLACCFLISVCHSSRERPRHTFRGLEPESWRQ